MSDPSGKHSEAIETLSFEVALAELEAIVDRLDRGEIPLEQSIAAYERGTQLRRHCEQKLAEARLRVDRLVDDGAGGMTTTPLDAPSEGSKPAAAS